MKFEFNTEVDGPKEAAALATALAVLHGTEVADALDAAASRIEISGQPAPVVNNTVDVGKAADGYTDHLADTPPAPPPQPTAADAFADPATAVVPVSDRALDTAGIPWDERIHASTKTQTANGQWTRRRNTPDATYDAVMAELKGAGKEASASEAFDNPTPSEAPAAPATVGSTETASTTVDTPATSTTGQTVTTAASPSSPPPPPPPTSAPVSFPQLMVKITKAQTAGKIDKATVDGFLASFGLDKIAGLASAGADTVAAVNAMVDEHVGA